MKDSIEQALLEDIELEPSSGLSERVMTAIEQDISGLRPIRFPWMRFVPATVALAATLGIGVIYFDAIAATPLPVETSFALSCIGVSVANFLALRWSLRVRVG